MPDFREWFRTFLPLRKLAPPERAKAIRARRRLTRILVLSVMGYLTADLAFLPRDLQLSRRAAIAMITLYQAEVSPLIRSRVVCRFTPSCSEYARQCFIEMSFLPALSTTLGRLSRCNNNIPLGSVDPVPLATASPRVTMTPSARE